MKTRVTMRTCNKSDASFRDPSGFVFCEGDSVYRQVNHSYKADYDMLCASGLYGALVKEGLLVPHEEVSTDRAHNMEAYKILKPATIPFISYPYEWCFSELKDAALLSLRIQRTAIDHGMTLKDCSAYNVQFMNGSPVFIDTLSFEELDAGRPWSAYKQFCGHFLAPLALMCYKDIRMNQLLKSFLDGIPLDMTCSLLPRSAYVHFSLFAHIYLHAKSQRHYADRGVQASRRKMNGKSLVGLIDSLESAVRKLKWNPEGTEWADYYENTNYSEQSFDEKKKLVSRYLDSVKAGVVWDVGANTGVFSRIAAEKGFPVISYDIDPAAVEINYVNAKKEGQAGILPLILDVTNPSPGIGWGNRERMSLIERGPADAVIALALIHHLAISNNLPFDSVASFFGSLCSWLIIEFIPKEDSQVQRLLASRQDIFQDYRKEKFERAFLEHFRIIKTEILEGTKRTLYLMEKHDSRR